ncbi:hypothetical protein PZ897_14420 [Hoeflea sp. YIM 152468]|uniref:hypothetical protein n=1 Tax=Hoeflea sp. YIM 152468 TaxID=3031759 RepID=UPI0023DABA06|nr:hypothetical protein [Hoeflea sp. YIM 152468]MDF1609376.1 hypothetical protein [Hoeflea sp. YIM 152468]
MIVDGCNRVERSGLKNKNAARRNIHVSFRLGKSALAYSSPNRAARAKPWIMVRPMVFPQDRRPFFLQISSGRSTRAAIVDPEPEILTGMDLRAA